MRSPQVKRDPRGRCVGPDSLTLCTGALHPCWDPPVREENAEKEPTPICPTRLLSSRRSTLQEIRFQDSPTVLNSCKREVDEAVSPEAHLRLELVRS